MAVLNISGSADGVGTAGGAIRGTGQITGSAAGAGDAASLLSYRQDISGTTGTSATSLFDEVLETGVTVRVGLRRILASASGRSSGAPSGPVKFRNSANTRDRISAAVDGSGNRTGIAFDDGD